MTLTHEEQRREERWRGVGCETAYCLGFMFNQDMERVILQLKQRRWQKGKFNGIGGKLNPGESAHAAMDREFNEEIETPLGPKKLPWFMGPVVVFPGQDVEVHVFFCTLDENMFNGVKSKTDEELIIVNANFLPGPMVPHVPWLVPFCREPGTRKHIVITVEH